MPLNEYSKPRQKRWEKLTEKKCLEQNFNCVEYVTVILKLMLFSLSLSLSCFRNPALYTFPSNQDKFQSNKVATTNVDEKCLNVKTARDIFGL